MDGRSTRDGSAPILARFCRVYSALGGGWPRGTVAALSLVLCAGNSRGWRLGGSLLPSRHSVTLGMLESWHRGCACSKCCALATLEVGASGALYFPRAILSLWVCLNRGTVDAPALSAVRWQLSRMASGTTLFFPRVRQPWVRSNRGTVAALSLGPVRWICAEGSVDFLAHFGYLMPRGKGVAAC